MALDKGNARRLSWWIRKTHDRFITTEDDNVFSPNFLEYMNKGLELFENDDSVLNLCAFRWYFPILDKGNTFFRSGANCTPWGMGYWTKKQMEIPRLDYKWFRQQLSIRNLVNVYRNNGPAFLNAFIEFCNSDKSHRIPVDLHMTLYMTLLGKHQIIPIESLVKNIGIEDMGKVDEELQARYDSIPTSSDNHFEFKGTGYECFEENQELYRKEFNWQKRSHYVAGFFKKVLRLIKYW